MAAHHLSIGRAREAADLELEIRPSNAVVYSILSCQ